MELRKLAAAILTVAALVVPAGSAGAATPPLLVQVTQTSLWTKPSPDPSGVAYIPSSGRLMVVDSEVEETPLFAAANLFEATNAGAYQRDGDLTPYTVEPTGITYRSDTATFYISDDDADRIVATTDGADDLLGTGDDVFTAFSTRPFGSNDIGDVAFVDGDLYWTDGVLQGVFQIDPGVNGVFDGHPSKGGDDVLVNSFDVGAYGQTAPEGLAYNAANDTINVISDKRKSPISEFTKGGSHVGDIDLSSIDIRHASGLVFAPSSDNASATSAYITDRGVDNNFDPAENDGKLYEVRLPIGPNAAPVVTDPGDQSSSEGDAVNLQIVASDTDGDPLQYSASQLPPGLIIGQANGLITGTIEVGAAAGSPYSVLVTASDGAAIGSASFVWTIGGGTPPATPTGLNITPTTRGLSLNWADNAEPDLAGYEVARATTSGGPYVDLTPAPLTASAYLDKTAPVDATSYYHVTAVDDASSVSGPASADARRGVVVFHGASKLAKHVDVLRIPKPSAAQQGDVLVASVAVRGGTITPPAGWTQVTTKSSGTTLRESVFTHVVGASEPTSYGFTFPAVKAAAGTIAAYAGVNTSIPVDAFGGRVNPSSTQIKAPSVTSTVAEGVLVGGFATATDSTIQPSPSMLECGEAVLAFGTKRASVEVSDQVRPVAGATGSKTAVATKAAVNIGITVVLRPA